MYIVSATASRAPPRVAQYTAQYIMYTLLPGNIREHVLTDLAGLPIGSIRSIY